jgi:DNA-binding IclR family transcriptional regulator
MSSEDIEAEATKGQRNEMRMISRAAMILRALAEAPTGLSLGQIAKATGLARSSVQRLVGALEAEGLASTAAGLPGVRLGVELVRLGSMVHKDVRSLFRRPLEELQARAQATLDLTVLMDSGAVVIEQIASAAALRVVSHAGKPLPIHCTASGKAHVMQMTREQAARRLAPPLIRYTRNTVTDPEAILALADTAADGSCAFDREEYDSGVSAIALPVRGIAGFNYAFALSMPTIHFIERIPFLSQELKRCQRELERAAGV